MSIQVVQVSTDPPYQVQIGPNALAGWAEACEGADACALIADSHVHELHAQALPGIADLPLRLLPRGEAAKRWTLLGETLEFLSGARLSRKSVVLALGGGATCDHAGLAASLFKRGCSVVHFPTSLLAQVDASVGGKTAINLAAGKNLAGSFHQPRAVFADTNLLYTLDDDELRSGLGEVLKTALLDGDEAFRALEANAESLVERAPQFLAEAVERCVRTKARIVAADPTERGLRRALNLGHTFAHAIEHCAGYGTIPHGVAVAAGLGLALEAGALRGSTSPELVARTRSVAERLGLPADLDELRQSSGQALPAEALIEALANATAERRLSPLA